MEMPSTPGITQSNDNLVKRAWHEKIEENDTYLQNLKCSEYEKKRFVQIQENVRIMKEIGLESNISKPCNVIKNSKHHITKRKKRIDLIRNEKPVLRSSRRIRGDPPLKQNERSITKVADGNGAVICEKLMTCEDYWKAKGVKPLLLNNSGTYNGWVEEGVRRRCRIEGNATDAWNANGGGKFTYKNPGGKNSKVGTSIKEVARKLLRKNPNMYFYRITEPGVDHWQGDWTEEENALFLETAKKYGVGNKWGLFATHIPHRVGYQCSAHYRSYFVGQGIIWDSNFLFNSYGDTVWNRNQK